MAGATPASGASRKKVLLLAALGAAVAAGAVATVMLIGPGAGTHAKDAPASAPPDLAAQKAAGQPAARGSAADHDGLAAGGAAASSGIPECDAYLKTFDAYLACDKVSQATKDASRQAVAAQKASWAQLADAPAEARKTAIDACKEATAVIAESARSLGCPR